MYFSWSKKVVFDIFVFVSGILFCTGVITAAENVKIVKKDVPHLVIAQQTFDAGKVIEGKEVSHAFVIKNQGSGALIIKQVKPG